MARKIYAERQQQMVKMAKKDKQIKKADPNVSASPAPFTGSLLVQPKRSINPEIASWRSARVTAMHSTNPRRQQLYDIYDQVVLDDQVVSVMRRLKLRCASKSIRFVLPDGERDATHPLDIMAQSSVFKKLLNFIMEADWFGHSLCEFTFKDKALNSVTLIPRRHVVQERGIVIERTSDVDGVNYHEPPYSNWSLEFGDVESLGLLDPVTPLVVYKRGGRKYWFEYIEMFGIPIFEAQYDPNVPNSRTEAIKGMENRGAATELILPKGTDVKIHTPSSGTGNDLFESQINHFDGAISKVFLLQTQTTDSASGSGYAQSKTHMEGEDDAVEAYRLMITSELNEKFLPFLKLHGFDVPEGSRFAYDSTERLTLAQLADVASKLAPFGTPKLDWILKTFGIPMDAPKATAPKKAPGDKSQLTLWSEPYPLHNNLVLLYRQCTEHSKCTHTLSNSDDAEVEAWAKQLEVPYAQMLERLHKSDGKMEFDSAFLTEVANILMDGLEKGFGSYPSGSNADVNQKWTRLFLSLRKNVFHFSSAKNYNELKELSKLMLDKSGNIRTFDEFEQAVKDNGNFTKWHRQYLKAEHSHALASSTMAAKWLDFNRDSDLYPNLKYETIGDKRVRDSHKELDGIVRPINDSFWDTHYPPLGWGCRCDVSPEDGGTQVTPEGKLPSIEIPTMFRNNVGKDGIVYSEKHPYFESIPKETKPKVSKAANKAMKEADEAKLKEATKILLEKEGFAKDLQNVKDSMREAYPKLTDIEIACLRHYSRNNYKSLNRELRNPPPSKDNAAFQLVLDKALSKIESAKNVELFRGSNLPKDVIDDYYKFFNSKKPRYEQSFISTTEDYDVANGFSTDDDFEMVIFKVKSKNAKSIIEASAFQTEKEYLIRSGTQFKITNIEIGSTWNGKSYYTIEMEEA